MKKNILTNLISFIALGLFVLLATGTSGDETPALNASVIYDGTQFTITNNDSYAWTDCKVEVNGDYKIRNKRFNAGETYTVGIMTFVDSNGKKFNPYSHKVQKIFLWCDNAEGKRASYLGTWN